jgi:hypothetical protein
LSYVQAFPVAPTNRIQRVARAVFCQLVYNHRDGDATCLEPRLRCVEADPLHCRDSALVFSQVTARVLIGSAPLEDVHAACICLVAHEGA